PQRRSLRATTTTRDASRQDAHLLPLNPLRTTSRISPPTGRRRRECWSAAACGSPPPAVSSGRVTSDMGRGYAAAALHAPIKGGRGPDRPNKLTDAEPAPVSSPKIYTVVTTESGLSRHSAQSPRLPERPTSTRTRDGKSLGLWGSCPEADEGDV